MNKQYNTDIKTSASVFSSGGQTEIYASFSFPQSVTPFPERLMMLNHAVGAFLEEKGVSMVWKRYFLSDISNQQADVMASEPADRNYALSLIQQAPLDGGKVSVMIYAVSGAEVRNGSFGNGGLVHHYTGGRGCAGGGSAEQTSELLQGYEEELSQRGETIADNCLRTWFFVQNVDVNYSGLVTARKDNFLKAGLSASTHYIASTGIEGRRCSADEIVQFEAYDVEGLSPAQVTQLKGLTHLNPTIEYGVTFERGTAVDYADRRHLIISGTASIDNKGQVLHVGNAGQQAHRLLENVSVLLAEGGASLTDVRMAIVYLRDFSDYHTVRPIIERALPENVARVFVQAPVCRPAWLIEMECIAIIDSSNQAMPRFI